MNEGEDKPNKIVSLANTKPDASAAAMAQLERNLPDLLKALEINAKLTSAKFKALVSEGFTREEALELVKS